MAITLAAAQAELARRRAMLAAGRPSDVGRQSRPGAQPPAKRHDWLLINGQRELERRRAAGGNGSRMAQPIAQAEDEAGGPIIALAQDEDGGGQAQPIALAVKLYPAIGAAALREKQSPQFRLWLYCHHRQAAEAGAGWLPLDQAILYATADLGLTRRRARQILAAGAGLFWTENDGRLWLMGAAAVATGLQAGRLSGHPVMIPLAALTGSIGNFNAHLGAAWHSGRDGTPISRATIRQATGIPERSQRRYERKTGVKRRENLAIGERASQKAHQDRAAAQGCAAFEFTDYDGRQGGGVGAQYIAWRLPNSYDGPHPAAARGRQKKINAIVGPVLRGAGERQFVRIFFDGSQRSQAQITRAKWGYFEHTRRGNLRLWGAFTSGQ